MNINNHFLILGGARSGKSAYALSLASKLLFQKDHKAKKLFIATASAKDEDMQKRIDAHKRERGKDWTTVEEEIHLGNVIHKAKTSFDILLIDCVTLWVSNMLLKGFDMETIKKELDLLISALSETNVPVILVSNEVGLGIVPNNELGRHFRDRLGIVNQKIASFCSNVIFMVAGIAMPLKQNGMPIANF